MDDVFNRPRHPYTRGLLSSIPRLSTPRKSRLATIEGMVPALTEMPAGCRFNNRCPRASEQCSTVPPQHDLGNGHKVWCHHPLSAEESAALSGEDA